MRPISGGRYIEVCPAGPPGRSQTRPGGHRDTGYREDTARRARRNVSR